MTTMFASFHRCSVVGPAVSQVHRNMSLVVHSRETPQHNSSESLLQQLDHIIHLGKLVEQPQQLHQLQIVRVVEPGVNRHRVLRLERVRRRAVVNDDDVLDGTPQPTQILNVVALVARTCLAKQPISKRTRKCRLAQTRIRLSPHYD